MKVTFYRLLMVVAIFVICFFVLHYPMLEAIAIAGIFTWIWEPLATAKNPNT